MQKARESACGNLSAVILGQRLIGLQVARNFSPAATLSDSNFFIFRTINSILIHKLNYKEHNEKRRNMYKLNSCLFFFFRREDTTKDKYHYSLTWTCEFPNEKDTYYFAHCYPYTYSDLQVCCFCFSSLLCCHFFTLECPS